MINSLYYPVVCLQCIWLWITLVWSCCLSSGYRGIQHDPVQAAVDGRLQVPIVGAGYRLGDRCAVHRLYTGRHGPRSDQGKRQKPVAGKGVGSVKVSLLQNEGNVLFNDALNTFYLRLCGVRHVVKDHSDSERGNLLPPHGLLFSISSKGSFICIIPHTG